jgi:hypothetical protein
MSFIAANGEVKEEFSTDMISQLEFVEPAMVDGKSWRKPIHAHKGNS